MVRICPVCKLDPIEGSSTGDGVTVDCNRCGSYALTGSACAMLPALLGSDRDRAILGHAIHKMQYQQKRPTLNSDVIELIVNDAHLPSPHEQVDNFIIWIGRQSKDAGDVITVVPDQHYSIVGATSGSGVSFVLNSLLSKNLIDGQIKKHQSGEYIWAKVHLTYEGWDRFYELEKGSVNSRKAFMAMKFNDPQLDKVFLECFKPAVKQAGFDLVRLDENPEAGLIDDRLRVEILTSRFLISDITHGNHGAYWEAGYAEGLGKPVIYTCEKKYFDREPPYDNEVGSHFDTNHHLTVIWEESKLEEAAKKLKATIRATLPSEAILED